MRFKTDENVPGLVVSALRADGHDVMSVSDQRMVGAADDSLARVCLSESRALLSLDLGLADIRKFPPQKHGGLVILRPARPGAAHAARVLGLVRERLRAADLRGQLWIVGEAGLRIRDDLPP
jgi:hypothetical protein